MSVEVSVSSSTMQGYSEADARYAQEGELLRAVTGLLRLLEAQLPANPASPKNVRKAEALERDMRRYFRMLRDAFPYDEIDRLYYKYVEEE